MSTSFHLTSVEIHDGIPTAKITSDRHQYNDATVETFTIEELREAVLAFQRALHCAEMIKDHCAKCEKCTFDALGKGGT